MSEAVLRPALERALLLAGGTHDFAKDVVPMLRDGRAQWWCRNEGAIITQLVRDPQRTWVSYWLVGGHLADVFALQPEIDAWAREQGARFAVGIGRNGWARAAPPYGWKPFGIRMVKELAP